MADGHGGPLCWLMTRCDGYTKSVCWVTIRCMCMLNTSCSSLWHAIRDALHRAVRALASRAWAHNRQRVHANSAAVAHTQHVHVCIRLRVDRNAATGAR